MLGFFVVKENTLGVVPRLGKIIKRKCSLGKRQQSCPTEGQIGPNIANQQ